MLSRVARLKTRNLLIRGSGRDGYSTDGSFGRVNGRLVSVEPPAQTIRLPFCRPDFGHLRVELRRELKRRAGRHRIQIERGPRRFSDWPAQIGAADHANQARRFERQCGDSRNDMMKSELIKETQRPLRFSGSRYYAVHPALLLAVVTFVFTPLRTVLSQSGRVQQPESKKQIPGKPKPPGAPPKIRVPENRPATKREGRKRERRHNSHQQRPGQRRRDRRRKTVQRLT